MPLSKLFNSCLSDRSDYDNLITNCVPNESTIAANSNNSPLSALIIVVCKIYCNQARAV